MALAVFASLQVPVDAVPEAVSHALPEHVRGVEEDEEVDDDCHNVPGVVEVGEAERGGILEDELHSFRVSIRGLVEPSKKANGLLPFHLDQVALPELELDGLEIQKWDLCINGALESVRAEGVGVSFGNLIELDRVGDRVQLLAPIGLALDVCGEGNINKK